MPGAPVPGRSAAAGLALLLLAACAGDGATAPILTPPPPPPPPPPPMSAAARAYLEELLDHMQRSSIRRLEIDWPTFRARVLAAAPAAQNVTGTRPAIQEALAMLGDGHSSFHPVGGLPVSVATRSCAAPTATRPSLPPTVGYVRVESFAGGFEAATAFAQALQDSIRAQDRDDLVGWIVDLRGNGGGNMYPMVAGVGPLLGPGTHGYFIDPTGTMRPWGYRDDGAAVIDDQPQEQVPRPYRLRRERPRIAVLTDGRVASSGEATTISFKHLPGARSFGTPTCGFSTANRPFFMSDGAVLNLTVSTMADRTRAPYGDRVPPDEEVTDPAAIVQRAVAWLTGGTR